MNKRLQPVVGQWYNHLDKGDLFQVVALDEGSGTIEIQEFDGALDELDLEEWQQMSIESAAQPEDWSGPVDELEPDDLGYTDLGGEDRRAGPVDAAVTPWEGAAEEEEGDFDDLQPRLPPGAARGDRRRDH